MLGLLLKRRRRAPRQDKPETAKQPQSPRRSRQTRPRGFFGRLGYGKVRASGPVRRAPLAGRLPASSRRTGATEAWWARTGPEPAVRRATTDCQVDLLTVRTGGSVRTRTSGGLWDPGRRMLLGVSALSGGRSWRRRPVRMARTLTRTTPKSPVRVTSGRTRLLPADWAPGGHQRPEELPRPSRVSLEKVLVLTTRRPLNLTVATAGGATHRPAVRRPDPSALLAGTPTRISRSNRVGPSGRSGI
jgi:hypothetical protein